MSKATESEVFISIIKKSIKDKMKEKNVSLAAVCRDMKVNYALYRAWLNGNKSIRLHDVVELALHLDMLESFQKE